MSESGSEIKGTQSERFTALWNMVTPDGRPRTEIINVTTVGGAREPAVIRMGIEDINPPITDERIVQINRAPDVRIIECVMGEVSVRCSELGIKLDGNSAHTDSQLDFLESIVFSDDNTGINTIPGMQP